MRTKCRWPGYLVTATLGVSTINILTSPSFASAAPLSSRECVAFRQGDGIWVIDPENRMTSQWVKGGVGKFSVSRNGRLVYDRFNFENLTIKDANIYFSDIIDRRNVKLTDDGKSLLPAISLDGNTIIYTKSMWDGIPGHQSKGIGTWLYSVSKKLNEKLAGILPISTATKRVKNEASKAYKKGHIDESAWALDSNFTWSSDGKKVAFSRLFSYGGAVSYWADLGVSPHRISPLNIEKDFQTIEFQGFGPLEILFTELSGNDRLVTVEPLSGVQRNLLKGSTVYGAQFSLDGKQVASFVREPKTEYEENSIWLINAANGEARQLTKPIFTVVDATPSIQWSRDGSQLLVWTGHDGAWIVSTKDGSAHELGSSMIEPAWTACPIVAAESGKQ